MSRKQPVSLRVSAEQEGMLPHPLEAILRIERDRSQVPLPNTKPEGGCSSTASGIDGGVHQRLSHAAPVPCLHDIETPEFKRREASHCFRHWPRHEVRVPNQFGFARLSVVVREQDSPRGIGDLLGLPLRGNASAMYRRISSAVFSPSKVSRNVAAPSLLSAAASSMVAGRISMVN